jgi:hypothetical protein
LIKDFIFSYLKIKTKNKNFIYEKIIDEKKINQAIKNCQALEKHHLKHQNKDFNPSSKIFKIINFVKENH